MSIAYRSDEVLVWQGDCIELMRSLPDQCMDSVVTDPPYALEFMGKVWDRFDKGDAPGSFQHWCTLWAIECFRVLKPGGHLLAFGGTRTWHRLTAGIEDAGFEIRDSIAWLYGSGFPKSLDVSKAIDKAAGADREVIGHHAVSSGTGKAFGKSVGDSGGGTIVADTAPATPEALRWQGWGTALKPAFEPIVVARKPLTGTVAANVLAYGTGALNIDATRIGTEGGARRDTFSDNGGNAVYGAGLDQSAPAATVPGLGRWPANVVLDPHTAEVLDEQSGTFAGRVGMTQQSSGRAIFAPINSASPTGGEGMKDIGGASRFFYVAKAPKSERPQVEGSGAHPTVKPLKLMQWLVRLVTPPGGNVLDPFAGSGTTVEACLREGMRCMAMERETDYLPLILHRIDRHKKRAANASDH